MGIETLAIASLGASIIGGGISAAGALSTGAANKAAANYRAQVANNMAESARQQGARGAERQGMKTSAIIGQQTAAQANNGLDVNVGSPVDVRASTAQMGQLDTMTILYNANLKAMGLESEGILSKAAGEAAETESYLSAGKSILGAATSVSDKWLAFKTVGVPGF